MRLPHLLSLTLILATCCHSPALALAQAQTYTLPNLNVNNANPTCVNVDSLLTAAQSDTTRLQNFVQNDIPKSVQTFQTTLSLVQQACALQASVRPLALLQAQASNSAKFRSRSKLASELESMSRELSSKDGKSQLYHDLLEDRADEISNALLELKKSTTSQDGSDDIATTCTNLQTLIQQNLDYLNFLSTQIPQQVIGIDLPQRVATLNALKAACAQPIVQTGSYLTRYIETNSIMQQNNKPTDRLDDVAITFNQTFSQVPSVGVAIFGLDFDKATPCISLEVTKITTTGFTLRIKAKPYVRIYNVYVNYIATLSDSSGIYILNDAISTADPSVKAILQANNKDGKTVTKSISAPPALTNLKSTAFLRSYDITPSGNSRLQVYTSADSSSINYYTWYDTVLNDCSSTILFWNGADSSIVTNDVRSSVNGVMGQNSGDRQEKFTLQTPNYLTTPEKFYGIYYIDIINSYNSRVNHDLSGSNPLWTLTMKTWSDTQVYQLRDTVLFACTYRDKSGCVTSN